MHLNSSYDFSVVKSLYEAISREIELGLCHWGNHFTYVESAVLSRHRVQSHSDIPSRPRYSSSQVNIHSKAGVNEEVRGWYCQKYQRNKCNHKSSHTFITKNGKTRYAKHICASCWQIDRNELDNPSALLLVPMLWVDF